jgi:uncharacterized protein involved in exopolysaccharide biosynthesis
VIANSNASLRQLEDSDVQLHELDLRIANIEQDNTVLRDSMGQARLTESLDQGRIANISIIEEPHAQPKPVAPRKRLFALGGLVIGIFIAGFTILLSITWHNTFVTVEELQRTLNLPVLASLSLSAPPPMSDNRLPVLRPK